MAGKKRGRKAVWPPSVHHHKPSGRDRIRVAGRDYWLGPHGSEQSRREYARLVAELAAPSGGPPAPAPAGWPSLAELAARFVRERLPSCSEKEQGHYRAALAVLLAGGRAGLRADRFGVAALLAVRDDMTRAPRRTSFASRRVGAAADAGGGWSRTHVNRQVVRLRTLWRWAEERGLVPPGSWGHLRTLKALPAGDRRVRHTERVRPAFADDLHAVLARLRAPAVRAMLELQWLTGARSGELRRLEAAEVDRSGDVWLYRPASHKNAWRGQERVVPIGPAAQAVLAPWLARAGEGPVFRTRAGRPYRAEAYGLAVKRAARKAGLPWLRPYCFRHGAKQRLTRECGLDAARAALGQKSIGTTNDYGHAVDLTLASEAARRAG